MTDRTWRRIAEFNGFYEVSDDGLVRSRNGFLSIQTSPLGYGWVALWHNNKMHTRRVHRLMALAFLPAPTPDQTDVCHNDGNPYNNALANLRWDTHANNMLDIRRHGTGRNQFTEVTHCVNGHPFDEANTHWRNGGGRRCRTCAREATRRYKQRTSDRSRT